MIYPEDNTQTYYIEYDEECKEVTLYRRHFFMSFDKFEVLKKSEDYHPFITNEGHPYKIFRLPVPPLGCIPDITWYRWMVDRLNTPFMN